MGISKLVVPYTRTDRQSCCIGQTDRQNKVRVSLTGTAERSQSSSRVDAAVTLESGDVSLADAASSGLIAVVTNRPEHVTVACYNELHAITGRLNAAGHENGGQEKGRSGK